MSPTADALELASSDAPERHASAAGRLASGGIVRLDGDLVLRQSGTRLLCDLVDPMPEARRCASEFEVMLENAQRAFERSRLHAHVAGLHARWRVVDGREPDPEVLWPL